MPRLAANRRETREDAADVLGEIGGAAAVEPLLARLLSAEPFEPYLYQRVDQGFRRTSQESEYRELGAVVEALGRVLERMATVLPQEVLDRIYRIEDFVLTTSPLYGDPEVAGKTILALRSCEVLRQTAGSEIERRRS
jgi:hypothetical protein